ncbi:MAG: hypothetical protein O7A98_01205, partial [Acidobacteria bacterium]|nr:hypothetical protein [Acidobacteriota bacterium]
YALPYFADDVASADGRTRDVLITNDLDDFRTDDIFVVDFRLEKEFAGTGNVGFTFSLDAFNLLNDNYVMQRRRAVNASTFNHLFETLSPRVYRMGVRLNWR